MNNQKKNNDIWVGVDQLDNTTEFNQLAEQEFQSEPDKTVELGSASRRDFLKYLGFGLGAATLAAGCDIPIKNAIPYVVKPESIVPGVATYYASSFVNGGDYSSILVKTREGRPIKIDGNSLSSVTNGGTCARTQAAVLSLYDTSRFKGPYRLKDGAIDGKMITWEDLDKEVQGKLSPNSRVRIVTNTNMSPTAKKVFADFKAKYQNTEVVMYDPVSSSALLEANEACFGEAVVPNYHFDKADVIVSFDADFLGTWISGDEYTHQYIKNRKIDDLHHAKMSRHIQVETHMSLTGSNADNRVLVKPSEMGAAIVVVYNEIARLSGGTRVSGPSIDAEKEAKLKKVAAELNAAKGKALVVSGSNNIGEQTLVNAINVMLDSYGHSIDFANASMQRQGLDKNIQGLIRELNAGTVDVLLMMDGANPAFDLPNADKFIEGVAKVGLKVSFSGTPSETAMLCDYVAPTNHFLESWGDVEPKRGHYSFIQPTIQPLFKTRQSEESLLKWSEAEGFNTEADQPYFEYLKQHWETEMFPKQSDYATFPIFWTNTLQAGVFEVPEPPRTEFAFGGDVTAAAAKVRKPASGNDNLEIVFFETINMGGGQYANNPWLLELPDPVARTVWGNYLAIPMKWEGGNSFKSLNNLNKRELYGEADMVDLTIGDVTQRTTAVRQFGQAHDTVAIALGYGRSNTGKVGRAVGNEVGINVYPWLSIDGNGNTQYYATSASVSDSKEVEQEFACVQYHHTMGVTARDENGEMVMDEDSGKPLNVGEKTSMTLGAGYQGGIVDRSIIYKAHVSELEELEEHIQHKREHAQELNAKTLYPYDEYSKEVYGQGHHWALHVDLNSCTGCGACVVACNAENNIPVVGKREVARHHEMTWLRIDRYFYGDYENPNVVYQPMMCQHCDNAPCENVCPVAATNHSSEGLNQMAYNRCIGTRYCANNCPYKVRRFNWLDYTTADLFPMNEPELVDGMDIPYGADNLTRMVLNPDVTVRSRGVIEKCSFCVQKIQEGKLTAKREGRRLEDGDIKSACAAACGTGAMTFGDRNDKNSKVS
ncbi:MAG: TAT-variant-translocated molybdopterin oxidoreductase, partial [Bacteroidota bacterium]